MFFTTLRFVEEFLIGQEIQNLELTGFNGSINWEPFDGGPARVVAAKEVKGLREETVRELLEKLRVENWATEGKLTLRAINPLRNSFGLNNCQVRFSVYCPPEQIREFSARTSNGSIRIKAPFRGTLKLNTSNGSISLTEAVGAVEAKTSNGRIAFDQLVLTTPSVLLTSNGRIAGQLELAGEGNYRIGTSNGSISLRLPNSSRGSFRAATSNGRVEFALGDCQSAGKKEVIFRSGEGPHLDITTSNGTISVVGY